MAYWYVYMLYDDCHNGFSLDLDDHKNNGAATNLFCKGVIGHPVGMILNQGPKTLIWNKWTGPQNKTWDFKLRGTITCEEGLALSRRPFENGTN